MRSLFIIAIFCVTGVRLSIAREEEGEESSHQKSQHVNNLEVALEEKDNENVNLREMVENLGEEIQEIRTENKELQEKVEDVLTANIGLQKKIEEVQNPPFGYFCSYQDYFDAPNSTITYRKLLYSSQSGLQGDSPGIDISTGKFVSGISGTWRVDFSLYTRPDPGKGISIFISKNGEEIPETWTESYHTDSGYGHEGKTGGRSVLLHLDLGDELQLATTWMEDPAFKIIFCVSLEQIDF